MALVFEILLEIFLEVLGEIVIAFGWEGLSASFKTRPRAHPALAAFGYVLIGIALGAATAIVFPHPLSMPEGVALLYLFLNPALFGLLMFVYGEWRRRTHRTTTNLATFWGGASFAFGLSAARFALLSVPTLPARELMQGPVL